LWTYFKKFIGGGGEEGGGGGARNMKEEEEGRRRGEAHCGSPREGFPRTCPREFFGFPIFPPWTRTISLHGLQGIGNKRSLTTHKEVTTH